MSGRINGYVYAAASEAYRRGCLAVNAQPGNPYPEGSANHAEFIRGQREQAEHNRLVEIEIEREQNELR